MEITEQLHNILSMISGIMSLIALIIIIIGGMKINNHISIAGCVVFIIANIIQFINYTNFFRISASIFIIIFIMVIILHVNVIRKRNEIFKNNDEE